MRIRLYWLFIFLSLSLGAFYAYESLQEPLSYDLAPQFDGNDYQQLYQYFTNPESRVGIQPTHPFNQRILVPFLASWLNSGNIIQDFQYLNLLFTLLAVWVTFLLWRHLGFELKWFIVGFIWLLFHWTGLIRLNAFDPITVDVPLYCFQALFLLMVLKRKFIHLIWLAPLATIQKESFIPLMIVLLIYAWWHNRKTDEGFYDLPLIAAGLALAVVANSLVKANFIAIDEGKSSLVMLAFHAKEAILNPFEIVRWLSAMAMAFGPALFLAFRKYGKTYRYDNTRNILLLFSLTYLGFGILAGGDMTRIIYLGFPFIATWIAFELQDLKSKHVMLIGLLSVPLMMLYKAIPNPAFEWDLWKSWYPEFASSGFVLIVLGYVLFVWLVLERVMLMKKKVNS